MGIASAIHATQMAGGKITPQAIADLSKQIWDDWRRALNRGDMEAATELEAEFNDLCKLFQES